MVPLLARNNVFSEMDVDLLAIYCEAHATYLRAHAIIEEKREIVKSPKSGYPVANPYVAIRNTAAKTMMDIMSEFGMGPASRSRISTDATPRSNGKKAQARSLLD
jgi:P27 family predicted phage terminase small subunit